MEAPCRHIGGLRIGVRWRAEAPWRGRDGTSVTREEWGWDSPAAGWACEDFCKVSTGSRCLGGLRCLLLLSGQGGDVWAEKVSNAHARSAEQPLGPREPHLAGWRTPAARIPRFVATQLT
jgi:hypothetical protein